MSHSVEYVDEHAGCAIKGEEKIRRYLLVDDDVEATARLVSETFSAGEPLCLAVGDTAEDMMGFSRLVCRTAARQGLGVIARNAAGDIVAFSISERWPSEIRWGDESQPLDAIMLLLEQMEHDFDRRHADNNSALHLFVIGVRKDYEGRGIVKTLVADNHQQARAAGLPRVYTEATSNSQHLFNSLGYTTQLEIVYKDFVYKGEHVFATILSPTSAKLMEFNL